MSRIGKKPIELPEKVEANLNSQQLTVKGPKGELTIEVHPLVKVAKEDKQIVISVGKEDNKLQRSLWGTTRNLVQNMVTGVSEGFSKQLEVNGVGYRVELKGKVLVLNVGYSHPVEFNIPEGIDITVEKNLITVAGRDKQLVGETSAQIRKIRKPEPYKGKGIKYSDEVIRRKAGKQAKASA